MTYRFEERPESRSGSAENPQYVYFSHGSGDPDFVRSVARASSPPIVSGPAGILYREDNKIQVNFDQSGIYAIVTVTYATAERAQPNVGSMRVTYSTTGETANRKAAFEHVASYPKSPYAVRDHEGAINVTKDGVEGCEVVVPSLKYTVSFRHPTGFMSPSQAKNIARATGSVNSETFLSYEPGEVLFLGMEGGQGTDSEAEVAYHFAMSQNAESIEIAGIDGVAKDGWDYAWIEFVDTEDGDGNPIKRPMNVHVERVYQRLDLASLLGFGG